MRNLFASSQGTPPWAVQKTEYSAPWAPTAHHERQNDVVTAVLQVVAKQKLSNNPLHSSIARPQWLSMGACGPLRAIQNVMHF